MHVEIYQYDTSKPVKALTDYGFTTEPWLLVVDRDGVIRARYGARSRRPDRDRPAAAPRLAMPAPAAAAAKLGWDQVAAWRAARHRLEERAPATAVLEVVAGIAGLHAQVMSSAELTLWARVEGPAPAAVRRALWEERSLVKTWAMRGTLHLPRPSSPCGRPPSRPAVCGRPGPGSAASGSAWPSWSGSTTPSPRPWTAGS